MWKEEYKEKNFYWGLKADNILVEYLDKIPKGKALDIGAGEGRNSLFLAQNGFEVKAIDKIPDGLKKCEDLAKKNSLPITTEVVDVARFDFKPGEYSLVISVAAISFSKKTQLEELIKKIKKSLTKGGIVYIKEFTISDPMFKKFSDITEQVEPNTFYSNKIQSYRYFFNKNELKKLFEDYDILYYKEYLQEDAHPEPHQHGIVEIVAQKKKG